MTAPPRRRLAGRLGGGTAGLWLVAAALASAPPAQGQGIAVIGADAARVRVPGAAVVEPYANAGYRLRLEGDVAVVEVSLAPLASRDPFALPDAAAEAAGDPVASLARAVTAGASTRYEAVSRVLTWVGRNIAYRLDRQAPQDAIATLARREGYCTGVARLTVALLAAVDIPAREVPGFVAAASGGVPAGFHRWVEVRYDDVGWVMSDPLVAHQYVPATYVRIASETLLAERGLEPELLARIDRRQPADLLAEAAPGVTVRRNSARQRAAALRVSVAPQPATGARLVLEGQGRRRERALREGAASFVGLSPGDYLLRIEVEGWPPVVKRVILRDRVAATIHLPLSLPAPAVPAAAVASLTERESLQ